VLQQLMGAAARRLRPPPRDMRGGRVVAVIECVLDQNARDAGAAVSPAMNVELLALCQQHAVGIVQLPCPEIACLGWTRQRPPGTGIAQALDTDAHRATCARLAEDAAQRLQARAGAGCPVLAVVGGNERSPGCAVHGGCLQPGSGLLMHELQRALRARGLDPPFCSLRDADPALQAQDLQALRVLLEPAP
jgi:predicted secreted protein